VLIIRDRVLGVTPDNKEDSKEEEDFEEIMTVLKWLLGIAQQDELLDKEGTKDT
jgi:hypothetical protein